MIPIVFGTQTSLRSMGRIARPCALCGDIVRHELIALDERMDAYLIPVGTSTLRARFALCKGCGIMRGIYGVIEEAMPAETEDPDLRRAAPKDARQVGKHLRKLRKEAADPQGGAARREILDGILVTLDDAWRTLPESDAAARQLRWAAILSPLAGLLAVALAPSGWARGLLIGTGIAFVAITVVAVWSGLTARARLARAHFVPLAAAAVSKLPLSEDDARIAIDRGLLRGSRIARIMQIVDLVKPS